MSQVFLIEKEVKKVREKIVVSYKYINKTMIEDSHNLPNKHKLSVLISI